MCSHKLHDHDMESPSPMLESDESVCSPGSTGGLSPEERQTKLDAINEIAHPLYANLPNEFQAVVNMEVVVRDAMAFVEQHPDTVGSKLELLVKCTISTFCVRHELTKMAKNKVADLVDDNGRTFTELEALQIKTVAVCKYFPAVEGLAKYWREETHQVVLDLFQTTLMKSSAVIGGRCKNWPLWRTDENTPRAFPQWLWMTLKRVAHGEYQKEKLLHNPPFPTAQQEESSNSLHTVVEVAAGDPNTDLEHDIELSDTDTIGAEPSDCMSVHEDYPDFMHVEETNQLEIDDRDTYEEYERAKLLKACLDEIDVARARSKAVAKAVLVFSLQDPACPVRDIVEILNNCLRAIIDKLANEFCKKLWMGCGLGMDRVTTDDVQNAKDLIQYRLAGLAEQWRQA